MPDDVFAADTVIGAGEPFAGSTSTSFQGASTSADWSLTSDGGVLELSATGVSSSFSGASLGSSNFAVSRAEISFEAEKTVELAAKLSAVSLPSAGTRLATSVFLRLLEASRGLGLLQLRTLLVDSPSSELVFSNSVGPGVYSLEFFIFTRAPSDPASLELMSDIVSASLLIGSSREAVADLGSSFVLASLSLLSLLICKKGMTRSSVEN